MFILFSLSHSFYVSLSLSMFLYLFLCFSISFYVSLSLSMFLFLSIPFVFIPSPVCKQGLEPVTTYKAYPYRPIALHLNQYTLTEILLLLSCSRLDLSSRKEGQFVEVKAKARL